MTNGDKIRSRSDEELARSNVICPVMGCAGYIGMEGPDTCYECVIDWLRKEAIDDEPQLP